MVAAVLSEHGIVAMVARWAMGDLGAGAPGDLAVSGHVPGDSTSNECSGLAGIVQWRRVEVRQVALSDYAVQGDLTAARTG